MDPTVAEWVRSQLDVLDITAERRRPWAQTWRVEASTGRWWLKVSPPRTGYEPRLLQQLAGLDPALVPLCHPHHEQPWALVADAGTSARELLAGQDRESVISFWCHLLPRYAQLQQKSQQLVASGLLNRIKVPVVTPGTLVEHLDQLLDDRRWFRPEVAPDYSPALERRVRSARRELAWAADELGAGPAPAVQHDDLHAGNVFSAAGRVRVIDWGDAVIGHPFGTLRVTLDALADQLRLDSSAPELRRVSDAYLEVWRVGGASWADLRHQLDVALGVAGLGRALGWARALGEPEAGLELGFADAVAGWLMRFADDLLAVSAPGAPELG